jgi:hypothetical protein
MSKGLKIMSLRVISMDLKYGLIRRVASIGRGQFVVFSYLNGSKIWPDKKGGLYCRPVYYYVFAVFTTLFYSKLRPTFEPDYSTLEQTSLIVPSQ